MRLINCETYQLEEFQGPNIPGYAILSHTWGEQEVSFTEFDKDLSAARLKHGFRKIRFTCQQALDDGYSYAWADTVCIDKSSSAELSESINSMFQWYKRSSVCYVFLSDVGKATFEEDFHQSRWFFRGWTLQELIAPRKVIFFDSSWTQLGSKQDHMEKLHAITRIDRPALQRGKVDHFCAAKRMAWASQRQTTRVEDMAYCLLGLFDISMPLLYGEGDRAFMRLQREILDHSNDDSILAWGLTTEKPGLGLPVGVEEALSCTTRLVPILAKSPKEFSDCHDLEYGPSPRSALTFTSIGLDMRLPLVKINTTEADYLGILSCSRSSGSHLLGIILSSVKDDDSTSANIMMRVAADEEQDWATVLVGPRTAAQAIPTQVTIFSNNLDVFSRILPVRCHHIVVNQSPTFQSLNYEMSEELKTVGSNRLRGEPIPGTVCWNADTRTFMLSDWAYNRQTLILDFRPVAGSDKPEILILLQNETSAVYEKQEFLNASDQEFNRRITPRRLTDDDEDELFLQAANNRMYRILLTTTVKVVHSWTINDIFVDAVEVS